MAKKLILTYLYDEEQEDRDHLGKKRIEMAGELMMQLFVSSFKFFLMKSVKTHLQKYKTVEEQLREFEECPPMFFNKNIITKKVQHALSTGNWGVSVGEPVRLGVAQHLKRETSHFAATSYMRKCVAPIPSKTKVTQPRLLHNTHYGYICPSETPEGEKIGLVKNFSLLTKITENLNPDYLNFTLNLLIHDGKVTAYNFMADYSNFKYSNKIVINGKWFGFCEDIDYVFRVLKRAKRKGVIHPHISISMHKGRKEIKIRTDAGRMIRPLLVVHDNKVLLTKELYDEKTTFKELYRRGHIEWVDAEEE